MPRHPRCLLPETKITSIDAIAGFVADYEGSVHDFELENGTKFSVTANHPVLTEKGFLPACGIDRDTKIFCNDLVKNDSRPTIKEFVERMELDIMGRKLHEPEDMPVTRDAFHGDGQFCNEIKLIENIPPEWDDGWPLNLRSALFDLFLWLGCDTLLLSASEAFINQYNVLQKWYKRNESRGIAAYRYKVKRERRYKGKVYDLQTLSSMYYADGAIVSNCRCLWLPWVKSWRDLGIDADDLKKAARPWLIREKGNIDVGHRKVEKFGTTEEDFPGWWKTLNYEEQIQSIGPVRTRLINAGKLSWKDLVNKNTGHYYTLHELGFDERGNPL